MFPAARAGSKADGVGWMKSLTKINTFDCLVSERDRRVLRSLKRDLMVRKRLVNSRCEMNGDRL